MVGVQKKVMVVGPVVVGPLVVEPPVVTAWMGEGWEGEGGLGLGGFEVTRSFCMIFQLSNRGVTVLWA